MIKYELRRCNEEISYKNKMSIEGLCWSFETETDLIKSFDNKEDALKELEKYEADLSLQSNGNYKYFTVEQYFVIEAEYDEDDEWIAGGDIWGWTPLKIELIKKYDTRGKDDVILATFDNYKEAKAVFDKFEDDENYEDADSDEGFEYVDICLNDFDDKGIWIKEEK